MVIVSQARLRDFLKDGDGWFYSVTSYDNSERIGCLLRYIPDSSGDRIDTGGRRYRKVGFLEAYKLVNEKNPAWSDIVHRIPVSEISVILKPDEQINKIAQKKPKIARLVKELNLPDGFIGVTGSLLCGLGSEGSDIDAVVYGDTFRYAQNQLQNAFRSGRIEELDEELWTTVYKKRNPDTSFDEFLAHEKRKWNRGQIDGTYFDLLYTRSYSDIKGIRMEKGEVLGKYLLEAEVIDDKYVFDSPAIYEIKHPEVSRVLSFTHTYTGQAFNGEIIQANGVLERHRSELWLIVGTTREAKGEWIRSLTLLDNIQ